MSEPFPSVSTGRVQGQMCLDKVFDLSSLASDKRDPYVALSDIRASQDIRSKDPMSCLGAGHIGQKR